MENERNPQVIYFKDLLFAALKRWRSAVILGVVLALALCSLNVITNLRSYNTESNQTSFQEELAQYELNVNALTVKQNILQERLSHQQDYLNDSYLMNLDAYNFYMVHFQVYIDTGYQINPDVSFQNTDKTVSVLTAYSAAFTGADSLQKMGELLGIQAGYVQEIISCETNPAAATLSLSVYCADSEDAQKVLSFLTSQLAEHQTRIAGAVCDHTVMVLNQSSSLQVDQSLAAQQAAAGDQLSTLLKNLTEAENSLTTLQASAPSTTTKSDIVKGAVIFAVLGFALGIFLSCCVIWLAHIVSSKVYSGKTLQNVTGVKILGALRVTPPKTNLDKWLLCKEGRNLEDPAVQTRLLATDISCRIEGNVLLVCGSATSEALLEALRKATPDTNIVSGNILNSPDALNALKTCDCVVLVEACHTSGCSTVTREIEIINDYNKPLIGCVVLDG